jgi:ferredoxin
MFVGGIVVEDNLDGLFGWNRFLDGVEEADEPRMSLKKAQQLHDRGQPTGDCVDCHQCLNVCPTGVDIRDGIQLGCIQCGLCIDACDTVMAQIGRPSGLIAYDTDINGQRRLAGKPPIYRIIRARTILYACIIALVGGIMLYALATRSSVGVNVLHERAFPIGDKPTDSISAWLAPYSRQHCPGIHRRDTGLPTLNDRLAELCRGQNGQSLARTFFARALYESLGHSACDARGAFQRRHC